jgi:hypothetical protein
MKVEVVHFIVFKVSGTVLNAPNGTIHGKSKSNYSVGLGDFGVPYLPVFPPILCFMVNLGKLDNLSKQFDCLSKVHNYTEFSAILGGGWAVLLHYRLSGVRTRPLVVFRCFGTALFHSRWV